jgi:UDP-N-acetylmuramoyl-L-alanyl-D-glutamate--2,6-diaminopimelate ligase
LQRELDRMAMDGARACVMEIGAGAVDAGALHGVEFRMVRDGRRGVAPGLVVERLTARGSKARWDGMGGGRTLLTALAGRSQVEALGQALSILSELGHEPSRLAAAAAAVPAVPGWMEPVQMGQRFGVFVDGADCADGLGEALADARELGHGRTLVVTGPRPSLDAAALGAMARAAGRGSDAAWVTTDDLPEGEWEEASAGFASWAAAEGCRVTCERDRHRALARALGAARPGDVVVLAGKGRRPVQAKGMARMPWDDGVHARAALASLGHVGGTL